LAYHLVNLLFALLPPTRMFALKRFILRVGGVAVGAGTRVCGGIKIYGAGKLYIGRDCWVGIGCRFFTGANADITIGDRCDLAPEANFTCGTHEVGDAARRAGAGFSRPIAIGSGTWVGVRATVLGAVIVEESCIIGAGALLLPGRFAANALIIGSPAHAERSLDASPQKVPTDV